MKLPSEDEINAHGSLDEIRASANFLGKTLQQATEMLLAYPHDACVDLLHMGPKAFDFYLQAALEALKVADYDLAAEIYFMASTREDIGTLHQGAERVVQILDYIIAHPERFDVDDPSHQLRVGHEDVRGAYVALRDRIAARTR